MNVCVPSHVVLLLKRLANVVSTLSISNHYFIRNPDKTNQLPVSGSDSDIFCAWKDCHALEQLDPPRWGWPRFTELQGSLHEASLSAREITLPWLNRKWSWPSLFSALETESRPMSHPSPPLPPGKDSGRRRRPTEYPQKPEPPDFVHILLQNPTLYDPLRTPRYPIVLCHGLYGFDTRGPSSFPSIRMHYWANVLNILKGTLGADVIVTSVPGTGSVSSRSESLDRQLQTRAHGRGVNLLAHSMGGLDCRYLISHIKPTDYVPLSLTTISTPHRGSPFMDWCAENLGLGKLGSEEGLIKKSPEKPEPAPKSDTSYTLSLSSLPSSFTTLLLSILDSPAYANLTSSFLNEVFNPMTPDDPSVKYFSVAGRMSSVNVWHPFWLPKMILDGFEEKERNTLRTSWEENNEDSPWDSEAPPLWARECEWGNDGLVTIQSAKWGDFLGIMEECDHWQMRGARGIEFGVDLPNLPDLSFDWSFRDSSRFTNLWTKEVKSSSATSSRDGSLSSVRPIVTTNQSPRATVSVDGRIRGRKEKLVQDDAVIKSSTEKLSAVLDWLIEQVPSSPVFKLSSGEEVSIGDLDGSIAGLEAEVRAKTRKSELETKQDLERFFVALCRKIYDEGL
ncbi:hypothetical protein APHAL10511_002644 [Amanita phalloides]|nr:hypothetical protein APHAL10511_002644 [Amanita phalloides]